MAKSESAARKIIHLDMDAFFASVEQRDRPELRGQPVVVGGDPEGRGVVAAASYEARRFGIRSAMSCRRAQRLCPNTRFVRPDIRRYRAVSKQVFAILRDITPLVEPVSVDEAFLDVTENRLGEPLAREVARHAKARIQKELALSASAGVAPNKMVAKIASGMQKPDGLVVVAPTQVEAFLAELPIEKLWGVGPATAARLHDMDIRTIRDLRPHSPAALSRRFGRFGAVLHELAFGRDLRPVETTRTPKSRGAETTFRADVTDLAQLEEVLDSLCQRVARSLQSIQRTGRTLTLKVRYDDFHTITRSRTLTEASANPTLFHAHAIELLHSSTHAAKRPVRLVGIHVSNLLGPDDPEQLSLLFPSDPGTNPPPS